MTLKGNIEVPKVAFGLKVPSKKLKLSNLELDLYLSMLTTILFGSSSLFREEVRQKKLITEISGDWERIENFKTYYLMATTPDPNELIKEIKKVLDTLPIDKESFERIKKVWIASEVKIYDNVDLVVGNSYYDILKYGEIIPNRIEMIKKMKYKKLEELVKSIDFDNISIVKMLSNK